MCSEAQTSSIPQRITSMVVISEAVSVGVGGNELFGLIPVNCYVTSKNRRRSKKNHNDT